MISPDKCKNPDECENSEECNNETCQELEEDFICCGGDCCKGEED